MNLLSSLFFLSPSSFSVSLSVSVCLCFREVLWSCCCGVLWYVVSCVVVWCVCGCGVWCVVCDHAEKPVCPHPHVPVCTINTSPCVPAPRANVSKHVCGWCRHTRGRAERTHGDVWSGDTGGEEREREGSSSASFFIGKTRVFWTSLEHLKPDVGFISHRQFSAYQNFAQHTGYHVLQRFTRSNYWILPIVRMGLGQHIPCTVQLDAQSLNAPLWPKDKDHHDNDMSTAPHHTQPPNQQRRATHDITRHHNNKNTKTHTYTHMYLSMSLILLISHKKRSGTRTLP